MILKNQRRGLVSGFAQFLSKVCWNLIMHKFTFDPSSEIFLFWNSTQARSLFKDRKFPELADPLLQHQYPRRGLSQALAVAAMCVQEQPRTRPFISDVVTALNYLASQKYNWVLTADPMLLFGSCNSPLNTERDRWKKIECCSYTSMKGIELNFLGLQISPIFIKSNLTV